MDIDIMLVQVLSKIVAKLVPPPPPHYHHPTMHLTLGSPEGVAHGGVDSCLLLSPCMLMASTYT